MQAVGDQSFRQLHQLGDEEHAARRSVARLLVLRLRRARNHGRRGMLDLHLGEQHGAVLGDLNLPGPADKHLERPARSQI